MYNYSELQALSEGYDSYEIDMLLTESALETLYDDEPDDNLTEAARKVKASRKKAGKTKVKTAYSGKGKKQKAADKAGLNLLKAAKKGDKSGAMKSAKAVKKFQGIKSIKVPKNVAVAANKVMSAPQMAAKAVARNMKRGGKRGAKNESALDYSSLRYLMECGDCPSPMAIQADQMGQPHGYGEWEDDACPYTGEAEESEEFPRGGNFPDYPEYEVE